MSDYRPVAAARKTVVDRSSNAETGLLINVIRTLTSSVSEDQRELEKARLEKGHAESGALIDRLVQNHQKDVSQCLEKFRDTSETISSCRERIHNVQNALQQCKSLLELKRDDLKKLWNENAQQRQICDIINQIDELKEAPVKISQLLHNGLFQEAGALVISSKAALNGRLQSINGLAQLRAEVEMAGDDLVVKVNDLIVNMIVVEPFEHQLFTVVTSIPEARAQQNSYCLELTEKAKHGSPREPLKQRLSDAVKAIAGLKKGDWDVDRVIYLSRTALEKHVANTVQVLRVLGNIDDNSAGDDSNLAQLIQIFVAQLESSCQKHQVFDAVLDELMPDAERRSIVPAFWDSAQSVLETLISDHLDINPMMSNAKQSTINAKKALFRFEGTACATATSVVNNSTQNTMVVCKPSAYRIVVMFPWLTRLMESIENQLDVSPCNLRRFLHSFVMEMFVERVKCGLAERVENALRLPDSAKSAERPNVLASCETVLELCKEVHGLIVSMSAYADKFSALWLLLLTDYYRSMEDAFDKMTPSTNDVEGSTRRLKLSAAWAADDDISRLLMSLPNWHAVSNTPLTPAAESESDIKDRNKRESEILIANLGTQAQNKMKATELMTEMNDVAAFAYLHESLRWFCDQNYLLMNSLPNEVKETLTKCTVQMRMRNGEVMDNESVLDALDECTQRLNTIADTCLLMLHIEVRVHCFFHLLPLAKQRNTSAHEEVDPEVVVLGKDLQEFAKVLSSILSVSKLRYVFDGVGHLCASIFIHLSQFMPRLTEAGKKRVCRNVWGVQQRLSSITSRRESELDRARAFFDLLLSHDPDSLLSVIPDKRSVFTPIELSYLLALAVRSDKTLASQHGALEQRQQQLNAILRKN